MARVRQRIYWTPSQVRLTRWTNVVPDCRRTMGGSPWTGESYCLMMSGEAGPENRLTVRRMA